MENTYLMYCHRFLSHGFRFKYHHCIDIDLHDS